MRALAEREGIDLAASYAYSDSESDLPMLRLVGHPVAVNPDSELARDRAREGWEILRFEQLGRRLKALARAGRDGPRRDRRARRGDAARGGRPAGLAAQPGGAAPDRATLALDWRVSVEELHSIG